MTDRLSFLCFGVGAIGTYLGGSLALADQNVTFIEYPQIAAEVLGRGLRLKIGEAEQVVSHPVVVSSVQEALLLKHYDAAIVAVKSFDTEALAQSLVPFKKDFPPLISFQNGVENEAVLARYIGPEKVIAGTLTSAIGRRAAGDIILERLRGVGITGSTGLALDLVKVFNLAGCNARLYQNGASLKWSKMLTNLMGNATSAILNMIPAEIYADPRLYRLELRQLRETLAVMDALHIPVVDTPATTVRQLAFAVRYLPALLSRPLVERAVGKGHGAKMPSFHIDLYSGRPKSEVDYLNGAVVRFGKQVGVPTPVNQLFNQTLLALTSKEIERSEFAGQAEKLLAGI